MPDTAHLRPSLKINRFAELAARDFPRSTPCELLPISLLFHPAATNLSYAAIALSTAPNSSICPACRNKALLHS
jgi:hypothetical protein